MSVIPKLPPRCNLPGDGARTGSTSRIPVENNQYSPLPTDRCQGALRSDPGIDEGSTRELVPLRTPPTRSPVSFFNLVSIQSGIENDRKNCVLFPLLARSELFTINIGTSGFMLAEIQSQLF